MEHLPVKTTLRIALVGDYNPNVIAHQAIPLAIDDATIAQSAPIWRGFMQATVVRDLNEFETAGLADRKALAELFPSGTRLPLGDGAVILINGHPQPQRPYRDGPNYRFPLRINIATDTP